MTLHSFDSRFPKYFTISKGSNEKHLTEIFPEVAPGNFTYYEDIGKHVMTRFYEFQWDLNYRNPQVFNIIHDITFL